MTAGVLTNFHPRDLFRSSDDTFSEGETHCEILEIRRRRQHHDVGNVVVPQRDGRLVGDAIRGLFATPVDPAPDGKFALRGRCNEGWGGHARVGRHGLSARRGAGAP